MAGGMNRRGDQGTMADRSKVRRETDAPCPMRHVWVADPADRSGVKRPGLLVMWRRTHSGAGWEALVLYGAELRPGEWAVVQEWVAEALLTQA
jgi:hypothetical protein